MKKTILSALVVGQVLWGHTYEVDESNWYFMGVVDPVVNMTPFDQSCVSTVWQYVDGEWYVYRPGSANNTLTDMESATGFWLKSSAVCAIQIGSATDDDSTVVSGECPAIDESEANGVYDHYIRMATSEDGLGFVTNEAVIIEHASVPDGVLAPDGSSYYVYYVNGEYGRHGIYRSTVDPTGNVTATDCVRIEGEFSQAGVDPDVHIDSSGKYKLCYYGNFDESTNPDIKHKFYCATSEDGIYFTNEIAAIENDNGTDPTVTQAGDGTWYMAYACNNGNVCIAKSSDGDSYRDDQELESVNGIPELHTFSEGYMRLYAGNKIYKSEDNGATWTLEQEGGSNFMDPSLVENSDGYIMFHKDFSSTN